MRTSARVLAALAAILFLACNGSKSEAPPSAPQEVTAPTVSYWGGVERKLEPDVFHFSTGGQPKSCDPHQVASVIENHHIVNTCEGLMDWGASGAAGGLRPGVATHYDVDEDGRRYTFHLRPDAKWSNGEALTAKDFDWSWTRARSKTFGAAYAFLFDEAQIDTWQAVDATTFVVTLRQSNRIFESVIPFSIFLPVHRATVEQWGDAWCYPEHTVVNGPYVPVAHALNDYTDFAANPHYWDRANVQVQRLRAHHVDNHKLVMDLYKDGQLDWIGMQNYIVPEELDPYRVAGDPSRFTAGDITAYPTLQLSYLTPNIRRKPFDDERVREALSVSIDRQLISETVMRNGSVPTRTMIPPGMSYAPKAYDTSPDCAVARAALKAAGYPDGEGFPVFEFLYREGGTPNEPLEAAAIAQQWKKCLGIEVKLAATTMELWLPRVLRERDFDLTFDGWNGDYPHPQTFAALLATGNAMNFSGYSSPEVDQLLREGPAHLSDAGIQDTYAKFDAHVVQHTPVIPLFFPQRIHAVRCDWEGIVGNNSLHHPLKYLKRKADGCK